MIRVVIADDQHLIRKAIRLLIEREADILVVGEAANGYEAITLSQQTRPDVLVLDINMPYLDGIQTAQRIQELQLPTQVLILSMYADKYLVRRALRNGARGYALKSAVPQELLTAIRELSQNRMFVSPQVEGMSGSTEKPEDLLSYPIDPGESITRRELEILHLIFDGNTNSQIARHLGISVKTVEKHRQNLMKKLSVHDTASLVRKAVQRKLIFVETQSLSDDQVKNRNS
jgi:DNA-binding NarL/FixJ family response regulator